MRSGDKPLLVTHKEALKDVNFIESQMQFFKQKKKIEFDRMCVILPDRKSIHRFNKALSKYGIKIITSNQVKGLTYDVVFSADWITTLEEQRGSSLCFKSETLNSFSHGRAKTHLYLLHQKKLSVIWTLREHIDYFNFD